MPFPVSPVCSWLVFWYLKWIWSLSLPGFPGAIETLHVKNDKGYCDFSVVCFLFPLKIYWLHWAQSSMAGWDSLNFQHFLGHWVGEPKNFDIRKFCCSSNLFLHVDFNNWSGKTICLVSTLTKSGQKPTYSL